MSLRPHHRPPRGDRGDVGVETIRYYQRRGLMTEPPSAIRIRRYGPGDIQRLQFIRQAQAAGFTLEEIGELLELDATDDRPRRARDGPGAGAGSRRKNRKAQARA